MKFQVRYPTGSQHEVELTGTLVTLGRDPASDLVLNEVKCSRRHAVVELGPRGLSIRDSGSANGVFINGRKVERGALEVGDVVRLGDVILKVLDEHAPGTVVMATDEALDQPLPGPPLPHVSPVLRTEPLNIAEVPLVPPPSGTLPPARPEPLPEGRGQRSGPVPRPLTVTVLAGLWLLALLAGIGSAVAALVRLSGLVAGIVAALGLAVAVLGGVLAVGLWARRAWARVLQIGAGALGLLVCPFTLSAAVSLIYMLRREVRLHFSGRTDLSAEEAKAVRETSAELTFTLTIVGTLVLGLALTGVAAWLAARTAR